MKRSMVNLLLLYSGYFGKTHQLIFVYSAYHFDYVYDDYIDDNHVYDPNLS